jgi:hypothetical protein
MILTHGLAYDGEEGPYSRPSSALFRLVSAAAAGASHNDDIPPLSQFSASHLRYLSVLCHSSTDFSSTFDSPTTGPLGS